MGLKNTLNGISICPGSASRWEFRLTSSGQSKNNETNSNPLKSNPFHYCACAGPALFPAERSQADLLPLAVCFRLFNLTDAETPIHIPVFLCVRGTIDLDESGSQDGIYESDCRAENQRRNSRHRSCDRESNGKAGVMRGRRGMKPNSPCCFLRPGEGVFRQGRRTNPIAKISMPIPPRLP